MDPISLVLISVGLAMDAFCVSICKGLAMRKPPIKSMLIIGLWFGGFQGIMPIIGYYLGTSFHSLIQDFDHWIAFFLLLLIGLNMIRESFDEEKEQDADIYPMEMLLLAIATSIDAFAIGISLAMDSVDIISAAIVIAVITFAISVFGVKAGSIFGDRYNKKAELAGGIILILIGVKILLEHLGYL